MPLPSLSLFNPWVMLGFLVAIIAAAGLGERVGVRLTDDKYAQEKIKAQTEAAADAAKVAADLAQQATNALSNYQAMVRALDVQQEESANNFRVIREEVPVYVDAKADAGCVVNNGFVLLYDNAFGGPVAQPAAGPAGPGPVNLAGPSGVPLSKVGAVSIDNAETCRAWEATADKCRAGLKTVTDFYNGLKATVHACK